MQTSHAFRRGDNSIPYRQGITSDSIEKLRIETQRLILRPVSVDDCEAVFSQFTPTVATYMTPEPAKKISETNEFLSGAVKARAMGQDLQMVIEDKETNEFLGLIGLHSRFGSKNPEVGLWLKEAAWGNGFGKEAVLELKKWCDHNLDYENLVYPVAATNLPSKRIPESFGLKPIEIHHTKRSWNGPLDIAIYHIAADK